MNDLGASIENLKKWIIFSGIQNEEKNKGGFNAWYDLEKDSYSYVYSEITGYGITTLLYLYDLEKKPQYLKKAQEAADWIINNALLDCGGVLTRDYIDKELENPQYSFASKNIYAFDAGMVLFGLCKLAKAYKNEFYLEAIKKIGDFLLNFQRIDGLIEPIFNAGNGQCNNTAEKWSTQSGSFHAKLAMGLLAAYDIIGLKKYKKAAIDLCDASLDFQKPNGRFVSFRDTGATHMHPHCYSCEGLYYAGKALKKTEYLEASAKGTIWSLNSQLKSGGMPCIYDEKSGFNCNERSDTLAQVLRMATYFLNDNLDVVKEYAEDIEILARRLAMFQRNESDWQNGGMHYGFTEVGDKKNHLNSWCSMFAVQALNNFFAYKNIKKITPEYLI